MSACRGRGVISEALLEVSSIFFPLRDEQHIHIAHEFVCVCVCVRVCVKTLPVLSQVQGTCR